MNMKTTKIEVPTYDPQGRPEYDYTRPYALTLQETGGVRVVMGDPQDRGAPDVFIERGLDEWRVIVHPNGGDPLCIIEIHKDRATVQDELGTLLLEQTLR